MPRALILAAALLVPAATATAQTAPEGPAFSASVSPAKAPKKRSKPVSAVVTLGVDLPEADRKTPVRITVRLPRNVRLSGTGFPACPAEALVTSGEAGCPAGSQVGSAVVTGVLSTTTPTPVTWTARVYVASANALALSFKGLRPAVAEAPVRSGGRRLRIDVPPEIRSPTEGLSTYVTGVSLRFGATAATGSRAKRRIYRLVRLDGCPDDRTHDLAAEVAFARNDAGSGGLAARLATTVACRRQAP
jgi:hypothetical protein